MRGSTAKRLRRNFEASTGKAPERATWTLGEDGKTYTVSRSQVRLLNNAYKKAKRG